MAMESRNRSITNKECLKSLIKHNCWSAIILGAIMLALGCVLRSAIFDSSSSATVTSSGMLFILIGVFIICMGPFSAIYEIVTLKNRINEEEREGEVGVSPRPPSDSNPPTYEQVLTALKSPSATYQMRYYPQILSPQNLSTNPPQRPPPPSYEDIIREGTIRNIDTSENTRRMTIV